MSLSRFSTPSSFSLGQVFAKELQRILAPSIEGAGHGRSSTKVTSNHQPVVQNRKQSRAELRLRNVLLLSSPSIKQV